MKVLVNLKSSVIKTDNIDDILKSNIDSIVVFNEFDDLKINYIIWTLYLKDQGWCCATKYPVGIEDPTLSEMVSQPMDKIVIDFNSEGINKSKSIYIRDIKLMLLND